MVTDMVYMNDIPDTKEQQQKLARALHKKHSACGALAFAFAILALASLLAWVVCLFLAEFAHTGKEPLLYWLVGGFVGGTVLFAALGFLFVKLTDIAEKRELDFLERCDGEDSFFVGEGTLATFEEGALRLHDTDGKKREIPVPYPELRLFSVCTRKAPKEDGAWSVVIEIPARYVLKEEKYKDEPPVLVQTDSKPRLYEAIKKRNLELLGEQPPASSAKKKYTRKAAFRMPDRKRRVRALIVMAVGILAAAASIPFAFLVKDPSGTAISVGAVLAVVGLFLFVRGTTTFVRAQEVFSVYEEGVFFKSAERGESAFLKWEEIVRIAPLERDGRMFLRVECAYGGYNFPRAEGAWEYLTEHYGEKCA